MTIQFRKYFSFTIILLLFLSFIFGDKGRFAIQFIGEINLNIFPTFILFIYFSYIFLFEKTISKLNSYDYLFLSLISYILIVSFFLKNLPEFPIKYVKICFGLILYFSILNLKIIKIDILKILFIFLFFSFLINLFSISVYLSQFFFDTFFIEDIYSVNIYGHHFRISDSFHFIFGKNIPIFTGLYESRTQFIYLLLMQTSISLYLLKQKNENNFSKTFLIIFLFFQIICGFMSSRGYFISLIAMNFFFYVNLFNLKSSNFLKLLIFVCIFFILIILFFTSVYLVGDNNDSIYSIPIIFDKIISIITHSERLLSISFLLNNSFLELLFGHNIYEFGIYSIELGLRGFHNSFITFFNNFGIIGLILYLLFLFKFFLNNIENYYESPNITFFPMISWVAFGFLHNIYFSIFLIIIISLHRLMIKNNEN